MKKVFVVGIIILFVASFAYAGGGPIEVTTPKGASAGKTVTIARSATASTRTLSLSTSGDAIGVKVLRGAKNMLLGWTEIPLTMFEAKDADNVVAALLTGLYKGTMKAMARTISGVSDIVTAPLDPDGEPLVQPNIDV